MLLNSQFRLFFLAFISVCFVGHKNVPFLVLVSGQDAVSPTVATLGVFTRDATTTDHMFNHNQGSSLFILKGPQSSGTLVMRTASASITGDTASTVLDTACGATASSLAISGLRTAYTPTRVVPPGLTVTATVVVTSLWICQTAANLTSKVAPHATLRPSISLTVGVMTNVAADPHWIKTCDMPFVKSNPTVSCDVMPDDMLLANPTIMNPLIFLVKGHVKGLFLQNAATGADANIAVAVQFFDEFISPTESTVVQKLTLQGTTAYAQVILVANCTPYASTCNPKIEKKGTGYSLESAAIYSSHNSSRYGTVSDQSGVNKAVSLILKAEDTKVVPPEAVLSLQQNQRSGLSNGAMTPINLRSLACLVVVAVVGFLAA